MRFLVHAPTRGVPPLGSVLTPTMTPGTQAVPIPDPGARHWSVNDLANVGSTFSNRSPDVIYPPLYWEASPPWDKEKFPASVFSDNQMPVPAKRPKNVLIADPYQARLGGQRQVYQPQVVQTWRGMKGTSNG